MTRRKKSQFYFLSFNVSLLLMCLAMQPAIRQSLTFANDERKESERITYNSAFNLLLLTAAFLTFSPSPTLEFARSTDRLPYRLNENLSTSLHSVLFYYRLR
eukprot:Selendium_serpulae@DN9952_c0_g1_i1.p1